MTKRSRATAVVEHEGRIVLTETRHGLILLPGGGINRGEPPLAAAVRELDEETGLVATQGIYLFEHESPSNRHFVFWLSATGAPTPRDDAVALHFLARDEQPGPLRLSPATHEILRKYLALTNANRDLFAMLAALEAG
ncbi:NUDIX domain-containing protein [Aromatoleum toluolicum]|nr:NUDIX domain-containing protein [Aromatoleum toluolicum]NMF96159.2 NUDIX domain-containing protein [Aromatoleum toluolicum]